MESAQHRLQRWMRAVGATESLRAIAALVPDAAVFAVDADQQIVLWSPGAEALLGFSADEMIGQHCLKGNRCSSCMAGCGLRQYGDINGARISLFHADGHAVNVRKFAHAFHGPQGEFLGGVELLQAEEAPTQAQAQAQAQAPLDEEIKYKGVSVETFHGLVTSDEGMKRVFQIIRNVAETDATVLVRGESGTGKELIARALHAESHRKSSPFLAINCASLSPTLLESELFGHVKGAFTGAVRDRAGLFLQADGGTLFLDEVGELPLDLQARLLRVLQERSFQPVGSDRAVEVDVRIVAATHRALRAEVRAGRFREDLMYRLRVVPVFLPPLRERRGDIAVLLDHLIARSNARGPRQISRVSPDAMRLLLDHSWPGNVRELQNVVAYAAAVGRGVELRAVDLPPEFRERTARETEQRVREPSEVSADQIREALATTDGNISAAADLLGLSRTTFWRRRRALGV